MATKADIQGIALAVLAFLIFSCTGIFSKLASMEAFLSVMFLLYLGVTLLLMGIYAILWQKVLMVFPLSRAYLFKSCSIPFSLVIAHLCFSETITNNNLLGTVFIMAGLCVLSWRL